MKLFFKKLLIFIVVTLICTMEIDATNIVTQYFNKYDCVNARSINTTKVSERKFKNKLEHGYKMGDSIRVERNPRYKKHWIVNDSVNIRKHKFFAY